MKRTTKMLAYGLLLGVACAAQAEGNAEHGKTLYQAQCTACHSIEYNGVGPAHKGVFGRKAGLASGFDYSAPVRASSVVWSESTLDAWLSDPEKFIPGQKMGVSVPEPTDRADLIAYLKKISGK